MDCQINQTFNSYYLEMWILDNYYWEWKSIRDKITELEEENRKLNERIRFLEQCLDNKEKVNKSLREELQRYKEMWDAGEE